ncbi:neuron navigator 3 isoform X1 [Tachysurus ichikawai]
MPAILVTPKMKSGLPKPVHSALPIPQAHIQTRMTQSSGAKLTHHSSLRRSSQGTGAPQRKSQTANETSADPQIYTDWANHYLAKSGHKRLIRDLQQDIADGVLLAEIIQVVANEKIDDINGYPESRSQMIENIDACLGFLAAKGVNIKGLCAEEIRSGNLKAILGLFFNLSHYKQQQKHAALKQANDVTPILQTARVRSASPAQGHSPWCTSNAPTCPVHIHEHEPHSTSKSVLKTQEDMQSKVSSQSKSRKLCASPKKSNRLPGPSIQPRRSNSRRSQSFKTPMLTSSQNTGTQNPPCAK